MIRRLAVGVTLLIIAFAPTASSQSVDAGDAARVSQITEAVHRSGAAQRCWNAFLRATPDTGSVRLRMRIEVGAMGAIDRVTFLDPAPIPLTTCVRTELRRTSMPAGAAAMVETTYSFSAGTPAPVPAEH